MHTTAACSIFLLLAAACGGSGGRSGPETSLPPVEDALVLETSFGDESAGEEFMLVRPSGIAIDNDGNVLVVDEDYVKIFSPDGEPIALMGGTGEGPGELSRPRQIWYGPSGYFTVFGGNFGMTANYFRPDRSYIERRFYMGTAPYTHLMEARGMRPQRPEFVYALGEEERVYSVDSSALDRNDRDHQMVFLFHQQGDSVRTLVEYEQTHMINAPLLGYGLPFLGNLLMVPLPERRVAYMHGFHDSDTEADEPSYSIHVLDLETMESSRMTHVYEPQLITWKPSEPSEEYRERNPEQAEAQEELNQITERVLADRRFQVPVISLLADGEFLFAYTTTVQRELAEEEIATGETALIQVDVFDASHGRYVASAWMPGANRTAIRNSLLYRINFYSRGGEPPRVEKYRLVPAVYGRR